MEGSVTPRLCSPGRQAPEGSEQWQRPSSSSGRVPPNNHRTFLRSNAQAQLLVTPPLPSILSSYPDPRISDRKTYVLLMIWLLELYSLDWLPL
jgi:hypothetical protein